MEEKNRIFSTLLKSLRQTAGYSQCETAELLYLSRSTYNHYEAGERTPSVEIVIRIAALFHIHPVDIIGTFIPADIKKINPGYLDTLYCGKYSFTTDDTKVLSCYNALQDKEKEIVLKLMASLKATESG